MASHPTPSTPVGASLSDLLGAVTASARESEIRVEEMGAWRLRYTAATNSQGDYLLHTVEMARAGSVKARMTLVRPHLDHEQVVTMLRDKASAWIEDYESREHGGETDFGPL